jgi:hypothetical protein
MVYLPVVIKARFHLIKGFTQDIQDMLEMYPELEEAIQ